MPETSHPEPASGDTGSDTPTGRPSVAQWLGALLGPVPVWAAAIALVGVLGVALIGGFALSQAMNRGREIPLSGPGAVESWSAKVAQNPQDVPSRLSLAYALRASGQSDAALAEYNHVLRDDPRDVAALYGRGQVLLGMSRAQEAESSFWAVLALDEGHVRAAEALGEYYASRGQFRSLVLAVLPATDAHPTEARLQYLLGLAYENIGHPDWAAARYRLALEAVPDMPEALEGLKRLGIAQ